MGFRHLLHGANGLSIRNAFRGTVPTPILLCRKVWPEKQFLEAEHINALLSGTLNPVQVFFQCRRFVTVDGFSTIEIVR